VSGYIIATVDTGGFDWMALGTTRQEANVALHNAYADHARQTPGAEPGLMLELINEGEVNYHECRLGQALRDGSPVPRSRP
jgi:hypothetical protein